jgi:hypothetical protein
LLVVAVAVEALKSEQPVKAAAAVRAVMYLGHCKSQFSHTPLLLAVEAPEVTGIPPDQMELIPPLLE